MGEVRGAGDCEALDTGGTAKFCLPDAPGLSASIRSTSEMLFNLESVSIR
jgi:hypothetical protein